MTNIDMAERIKEARTRANLSQLEISKKINITDKTYRNYEKGNNITVDFLKKFAEITNTDFFYLLNGDKNSVEDDTSVIKVPKLSAKVSAGYNIQQIDSIEQIGELILDISIFKTPPPTKIYSMQVDGYSMIPMIFPDSWVIFDDSKQFKGDGLYVINWDDCLMVKQISASPKKGIVSIVSANKDYQSWEVDLNDNQCSFVIFGKVIRTIL